MIKVDLVKLVKYLLKRIVFIVLAALIGFGVMYARRAMREDTYTASGTMYVYNSNPNMINYQYASESDLTSAIQLIDTYMVVVNSNKVLDVVTEMLAVDYPLITPEDISRSLDMYPVNETGVVSVSATTLDPQFSADIVNVVLDVAPREIIRVVGVGSIEIIDYAVPPEYANSHHALRRGVLGGMIGAFLAIALFTLLFILNRKVTDTEELTENYTPPVLASVSRIKEECEDPNAYLLTEKSTLDKVENYAKLRMNLLYTLVGKRSNAIVVTSPISGEGKSTIAANLAISCAQSKKVLLIDGDMRRGCQQDIFKYENNTGLSEVLVGNVTWQDAILKDVRENLDLLPSGKIPPNPAELLTSDVMKGLLGELGRVYELILLDMPPINIVSDPLVLSSLVAGCLFIVRQNYSDHKDIRDALVAAEMTNMNVLGFVFYGEKIGQGSYYNRKYYKNYYTECEAARNPKEEGLKDLAAMTGSVSAAALASNPQEVLKTLRREIGKNKKGILGGLWKKFEKNKKTETKDLVDKDDSELEAEKADKDSIEEQNNDRLGKNSRRKGSSGKYRVLQVILAVLLALNLLVGRPLGMIGKARQYTGPVVYFVATVIDKGLKKSFEKFSEMVETLGNEIAENGESEIDNTVNPDTEGIENGDGESALEEDTAADNEDAAEMENNTSPEDVTEDSEKKNSEGADENNDSAVEKSEEESKEASNEAAAENNKEETAEESAKESVESTEAASEVSTENSKEETTEKSEKNAEAVDETVAESNKEEAAEKSGESKDNVSDEAAAADSEKASEDKGDAGEAAAVEADAAADSKKESEAEIGEGEAAAEGKTKSKG